MQEVHLSVADELTGEIKVVKNVMINSEDDILKMKAAKNRELVSQAGGEIKNASVSEIMTETSQEIMRLTALEI